MKFKRIQVAAKLKEGDAIAYVAAGLPVEQEGYILSEEQITNVESSLEATETAQASLAQSQAAVATANEQLTQVNASLVTANATIATHETTIADLKAQVTKLEALDAGKMSSATSAGDKHEGKQKLNFQEPDRDPRF